MKIDKNRKLKGSVLLTVVSVMALLIIFMASTVTLATAANNRSHANYSDSQAEYTARAAIEGFSQALTTNNALAQSILAMDKGDTFTPAVVINDPGMGNVGYYDGNHWVSDRIKIEYIKDNWGYDEEKEEWANMQVLKVSATAKVGKQEKSICYYLEKTGESKPSKGNNIKGFQTIGGGGMQNNGLFSGALCLGLGQPDTIAGVPVEYTTRNDFIAYVTDGFVNGSMVQALGDNFEWHVPTSDSHFVITQDLGVNNSGFTVYVDYPYAKTSSGGQFAYEEFGQKDIPYLYVGGKITTYTGASGAGSFRVINEGKNNGRSKSEDSPFNVFAGSIESHGVNIEAADLYLFNDDPTTVSNVTLGSRAGDLYKWSSSVINRTADQFYSEGGSIYCNHNFEVTQNLKVRDDLVVQGNLDITGNGSLEVFGDLAVKGTINDMSKVTCHGRIFYDHGSDSVAYYMARNPEASGSLKPGYVKVENAEFGTYRVDNIEVTNKPVEGGTVVDIDNIPVTGYTTRDISKGHIKGQWDLDWNNWRYEDNGEIVGDIGIDLPAEHYDQGKGCHYLTLYEYDGAIYTDVPYYAVDENGNPITDQIVTVPKTYFLEIDSHRYSVGSSSKAYFLCSSDGKVTDKVVDFAYEYYIADNTGKATEDYTTEFEPYSYYLYNKDGEVTATKVSDKPVFYIVNPETKEVDTHTTDEPVSYYYYDAEADTFHTATESEAMDTSGGTKYVAWYNPLVPATAEYYYYDVDPRPLADNPTELAAHQITEAEAVNKANTSYFSVSSFRTYSTNPIGGTVYPKNMTKAALNAGSTKIVKQLDEAIKDIGGDPEVDVTQAGTSIIPDGAYNSNYDYSGITNTLDIGTLNGSATTNIDQSIVLSGTAKTDGKKIFKVKAASGMFIVLNGTKFDDAEFIIEGNDTVNFLLDGDVSFNKCRIVTNKIENMLKAGGAVRINESDKMNVNMYGKKNSTLTFTNTCFVCASARCPFTKIDMATGAHGASADWRYVDNYNHIITLKKADKDVNWIGSGLFDSSSALSDNFKLLYTNSTGDANNNINNDQVIGANWYPKYYDAY